MRRKNYVEEMDRGIYQSTVDTAGSNPFDLLNDRSSPTYMLGAIKKKKEYSWITFRVYYLSYRENRECSRIRSFSALEALLLLKGLLALGVPLNSGVPKQPGDYSLFY